MTMYLQKQNFVRFLTNLDVDVSSKYRSLYENCATQVSQHCVRFLRGVDIVLDTDICLQITAMLNLCSYKHGSN